MPNLNANALIQELNSRLAQPPREGECRKLIFWHDAEEEFRQELRVTAEALQNAQLIEYGDNTRFALKKRLCLDDAQGNYVIYCPGALTEADNWLLALELRSEQVSFDRLSLWLREMGLTDSPEVREVLRRYPVFFRRKEYRAGLAAMGGETALPAAIPSLAACVVCGLRKPDAPGLILALLQGGMDARQNELVQELARCGLTDCVLSLLSRAVDYHFCELDPARLAGHVLLAATSHLIGSEGLEGLESRFSTLRCERCYSFVHEWQESKSEETREFFLEWASFVEEQLGMCARMAEMPLEVLARMTFFPGADVCLLRRMMQLLDPAEGTAGNVPEDMLLQIADQRRTSFWYARWKAYYEGLALAVKMLRFHRENKRGFNRTDALALWKNYAENYYRMDMWYRQFGAYAEVVRNNYDGLLNDSFLQLAELVENVYSNWYLAELGEAWYVAAGEELASSGAIAGVDRQFFFYDNHVAPEQNRVWVIISDAMRYEVAAELSEQLATVVTGELQLKNCQGIFPTLTNFGMAALLPRKKLKMNTERSVVSLLADGLSTESQGREAVLQAANPASVAMSMESFLCLRQSERRLRVKGMEVVYLYHDSIDAAGHQDAGVFRKCGEAVRELVNVVKMLDHEHQARRVILTADHGFLYTADPLTEADKISQSDMKEHIVDMGRRHILTRSGVSLPGMQKVRLSCEAEGIEAWSPIGKVRLARQGGGTHFVHGGASLQEMMVPVVDIRLVRNTSKDYRNNRERYEMSPVKLRVVSNGPNIIRNRSFSIDLVQEDPVDARHKAVTWRACFEDAHGLVISDTHELIADRREPERRDRLLTRRFTLRNEEYDKKAMYYLVLRDADGCLPTMRVEYSVDLAQFFDSEDWF